MSPLFESFDLAGLSLKNRIVMAPMTRSRAEGSIPNAMMAEYYALRAGVGLIITEGVSPSPNGLGYARIPGVFNDEQEKAWRPVADAVHTAGGRIFMQLMHTGRAFHPDNLPEGARGVGPSAIALSGSIWTDKAGGPQPYPAPQEMNREDIANARHEFVEAAKRAVRAGMDGIELHAANGYLLEQFLNPNANHRTDEYGGSAENRMRFVLEVARDVVAAIGANRTAIRVSPYGVFNDTGAFEGVDEFYAELSRQLSAMKLAYIHVVDHASMGAPPVSPDVKRLIRENFKGAYILSGGYDRERAEADLHEGRGDLVAFGRPLIANPDFVEKLRTGQALKEADLSKAYTPGADGYLNV